MKVTDQLIAEYNMADNSNRSDNTSDLNNMEETKAKWLTEQEFIKVENKKLIFLWFVFFK